MHLVRGKIQAGVQPDQSGVTIRAAWVLADAGALACLARVRRQVLKQPPVGCRQPPLYHARSAVRQPSRRTRSESGDPLWCYDQRG